MMDIQGTWGRPREPPDIDSRESGTRASHSVPPPTNGDPRV